jgi:fumarylpyruvate hydrolase
LTHIRNIYCIGLNYVKHAAEMGNRVPEEPLIFSKPTHSFVKTDGNPIELPADKGEIHFETEIVLYIDKKPDPEFKVEDVVGKIALGIDFTLREVQTKLKQNGQPWLRAKGFKNAAVVTDFWDYPGTDICRNTEFSLVKNNETVQQGKAENMIFDFHELIKECDENFGLDQGDLIFTGTPEGVGKTEDGDEFILIWDGKEKGRFVTNLK